MLRRQVEEKQQARGNKIMASWTLDVDEEWSYADAAVDETAAEAGRLQVRVFLRAGHLYAPHLLPGVVQLNVDRVDAGVVGGHRVAHVSGDPVLLEVGKHEGALRGKKKKTKERE